jgi:HAD superfamily hydrolase (TIGR01490 family)
MEKRPFAVFDIDGTFFRSSLLIEVMAAMVKEGLFLPDTPKKYQDAYTRWVTRQGSYHEYIQAVVWAFYSHIPGVKSFDFQDIAKRVVFTERDKVYRFTRELLAECREEERYLLAISLSPKYLVTEFANYYGFDKSYGVMLEEVDGLFTGRDLSLQLLESKALILRRAVEKENLDLNDSIGVGDTEGDIPILEMVSRPICVNPNRMLYERAKDTPHEARWEVRVERKDVVYRIQ